MPITAHILDHRSHKTRHSEGSNSINSVAALSPISNGTTAVDPELESFEQRPIISTSVDQLEALNGQLKVENRIREGAENLLQMPLAEPLRAQVESELKMARHKIADITKRIESESRGTRTNGSIVDGYKKRFNGQPLRVDDKVKDDRDEREDFRTALHQATSYVKSLHKLAAPSSASPPHSPSSSIALSVPADVDLNRSRIELMNHLIGVLKRNLRVRYEMNIPDVVQAIAPALADHASKHSRATAYRLVRHVLVDVHSVESFRTQPIDWYMVKSLARDNKHAVEKEQAIKLIRALIELGSQRTAGFGTGKVPLTEPIMRALIAVAEHTEDPFKPICLQTLTEILLIDVELVARAGAMRVLLHALGEGPLEMAPMLSSAFLHLADSPRTREYLHIGTDLEMALTGVTDAYGRGPEHTERMRGVAKIIASMLRTWSGLMYFCLNDKLALRTLVDGLRIPSLQTRDIILDMFFDLLNIKPPEWHQAFIDGRRLTMYRKPQVVSDSSKTQDVPSRQHDTLKLTDQYIALLIMVFSSAGLMDALTCMLEETTLEETSATNLSRKATLLIAELLQMSNKVLPLDIAARIQALPRVFNLASDYKQGENRIVGMSTLSAIDSYNRNRIRLQPAAPQDFARARANSVEETVRRNQKVVEQARVKLGMQMDDKTFQTMLLDSQVMTTKDQTKWNYEVLLDLIEGPLLNPKRMEEAIKVSRYIRKLMSFFHPFNHRFSDLSRTKTNIRWVRLGCSFLTSLLASPDGIRFLHEDDFMSQIVKSFAQLDPFNGTPNQDPMFSKRRMQETLTYGYFDMLGTMSKRREGLEILESYKLFTAFYHLSELRSREDLIKAMIENLDYSIDGHSRIVLSKALTSSYREIRLYATSHVGELIRGSTQANAWTIRLLLTQLYDPDMVVQEVAVRYLEEACEATDVLQMVVEMHPTLDHLGDVGHPLLLKFMSTAMGFRYLYAADYIDREMELWFHERNLHYVVHIEVFLAKAFGFMPVDEEFDQYTFDGLVPPHFYGVMAKTDLGCQVLQDKGHFSEFVQFIQQHGLESEDQEVILKLKSVLWAVGNIGAAERGLPFLEEDDLIPAILQIAEESLVFSVRGTCFFVLGLISSTPQGAEILDDYQWEATLSPLGAPTGLCIPADIERFISIPSWEPVKVSDGGDNRLQPPATSEEVEVMTAIYNLANTVIANTASRTLAKMKSRSEYRRIFSSTTMLYRAMHAISSQHYKLPVRRYIMDLFNVELEEEVVKKLYEHAKRLKLQPGMRTRAARAMSIVGRPPQRRRVSDSDDESNSDAEELPDMKKHPAIKAPPVNKITGFDAPQVGNAPDSPAVGA